MIKIQQHIYIYHLLMFCVAPFCLMLRNGAIPSQFTDKWIQLISAAATTPPRWTQPSQRFSREFLQPWLGIAKPESNCIDGAPWGRYIYIYTWRVGETYNFQSLVIFSPEPKNCLLPLSLVSTRFLPNHPITLPIPKHPWLMPLAIAAAPLMVRCQA